MLSGKRELLSRAVAFHRREEHAARWNPPRPIVREPDVTALIAQHGLCQPIAENQPQVIPREGQLVAFSVQSERLELSKRQQRRRIASAEIIGAIENSKALGQAT